jgi:peptidyl-dipeptidase Dcp
MTQPTALGDTLLAPWTGPFGGLPAFGKYTVDDFEPAITRAMATCRAEIDAIAANPAAPDFDNTIVALERSGAVLTQVRRVFEALTASLSDSALRAVEVRLAPVLAAFRDETTHNSALFARVAAVAGNQAAGGLDGQQRRLLEVVYRRFQREGALLDGAAKARLAAINTQLASLYTRFSQNQLADEESFTLVIDDAADLAGLPADLCASAAAAAQAVGRTGVWLFANTRSSMEPFLRYCDNRALREQAWRMFTQRGDHPGERDNKPLIVEMLRLRAERASLLGFASHAHWVTDDNMAGTPDAALALLNRLWTAASSKAREEIAELQTLADSAPGGGATIEPWDYRYWAEKLSTLAYSLDENALKPYLQLDRLRDAMFWVAGQLYGLAFTPLPEAAVYHPQVSAYGVTGRGGEAVGVFYFDPYARKGKVSGAWMNNYRDQQQLCGTVLPIVSNNANFVPAASGAPVLISWGDAVTLFHEFGHGLHGLLSAVSYPTLAGTAVKSDFVEFPSQITERWLRTPEVLSRFALHHLTGEPMPAELLDALDRSKYFMQGVESCEYLVSALYDMTLHSLPGQSSTNGSSPSAIDPAVFELDLMRKLDCPPAIVMRHRPPHFGHIFAGDGYSAGYYVYLWADALCADAAEAFDEAGSYYHPALVDRLHRHIMSVGNSIAPDDAFRRFRGRDVNADALMRSRGFAVV